MEATFTHPVPDDSLAVNTPLTCTELRRALASIKKVKVSTVSYRMLKEVPESFLKILLDFFQRCWDGGTIPAGWKHAIVVTIHKHGKPRKELGSYRPISLTSHLGKVYERMIKIRQNERELNDLQQYSRRWNLRVFKMPEKETAADCIAKVCAIFSDKVGIPITASDIEVAHRTGQRSSTRARPILVRFFDRKKSDSVIISRRNLKNKGIVTGEDLT